MEVNTGVVEDGLDDGLRVAVAQPRLDADQLNQFTGVLLHLIRGRVHDGGAAGSVAAAAALLLLLLLLLVGAAPSPASVTAAVPAGGRLEAVQV